MTKNPIRYYELDLLRFIAAIAVVFFHFLFRGQVGGYMPVSFQSLDVYAQYGFLGVNLFFMISGFVILLSAMNRTAMQFSVSRIARLYPAFWFSVTLTAVVIYLLGGDLFSVNFSQYFTNLTMLAGFVGVEDIDGVYWTLYIELKFYALIFIILFFKGIEKIEFVLSAWLLLLLVGFISPLPEIINFFIFPDWAPYFIGGASFYLLKIKGLSYLRIINLLVAFYLSLHMGMKEVLALNSVYKAHANPIVAVVVISGFYIIFTLIVFDKLSWFRSKLAVQIGALTYPLYLTHQNIGYIVFQQLYGELNKYLLLVVVLLLLLSVAWVINIKVERKLGLFIKTSLGKLLNRWDNKAELIR